MSEHETEIILGNKQLAGIFVVVAVLLGVAFTAGYMVRDRALKKPASTTETVEPVASQSSGSATGSAPASGGQTHMVGSDESGLANPAVKGAGTSPEQSPLGARRKKSSISDQGAKGNSSPPVSDESADDFHPKAGRYLQVAAVNKDEAETVADVLHKKGFKAHAVPKPGSAKIFRVIVGPARDAGDLASTRDALRKTGFREVIVQTY